MPTLRRLLQLTPARLALLLNAGLELLRAHWQVRRWPFARLAARLGPALPANAWAAEAHAETLQGSRRQQAADVAWAVGQWTRRWPRPPTCLMQALAARRLLENRGLPSQLVFGVRAGSANGADGVGAHAWLCCGDMVLTGAGEAAQHQPIALYLSPARASTGKPD